MNTRQAIGSVSAPVALSASFNQDATRSQWVWTLALELVFDTETCRLLVSRDFNAGIGAVAMLENTNYVAVLGGGKQPRFPQNQVVVWDDLKLKIAMQIPVLTTVKGVRLSRTHIAVVLHNSVRVYMFKSAPELWAAFETADNPLGLCCLDLKSLIFPGRTPGQVQLVDLSTGNVSIIPAHGSALKAIDISLDGVVLATASRTGTLIRVFSTSSCAQIAELRRGVDHASIFSIAFAPSGQLLAVTSDKSTLHIFDIPHPFKPSQDGDSNRRPTSMSGANAGAQTNTSQKWGILGRLPLLPRVFSDVYSFASAHFEMGDEVYQEETSSPYSSVESTTYPSKGIIGWTSDHTIIVLGANKDGRWEKFVVAAREDGGRYCAREGWKRYLSAD